MTIEQQQELSALTKKAVASNDIATLEKIWKVIQDDLKNGTIWIPKGIEWWESSVPPAIREKIE